MRTRVIETTRRMPYQIRFGGWSGVGEFPDGKNSTIFNGAYGPGYGMYSSIIDEVGSTSRQVAKSVSHMKYMPAFWGGNSATVSFESPIPAMSITPLGSFLVNSVPSIPAFPAAELMDDLASLVNGNVNTQMLLPVALFEAKTTIAMIRNPFNLLKPDFRRRVGKLTASKLLAKGASIWLEQLFGWQQFKSDIDNTAKIVGKFLGSSATKQFLEQESRFSSSKTVNIQNGGDEYSLGTSSSLWSQFESQQTWSGYYWMFRKSNVHAKVTYNLGCHHINSASDAITRTKTLFKELSLSGDWRMIRDLLWEVVPFSFVIDWFVDTRGIWYLPNKLRLSEADVRCLCYSYKYEQTYKVDWLYCPGMAVYSIGSPWYNKRPQTKSPDYITTDSPGYIHVYSRSPGFPLSDGLVTSALASKGLTWNKLVTGGALFAQRFFH